MAKIKPRPRPTPRRIRSNLNVGQPQTKSDLSISIEQSHARGIRDLPKEQLDTVIDAICEGVKPEAITAFFAEQGWLTVSDKTFKQYLAAFKRVYPELLVGGSEDNLNGVVDPRKPSLDEEATLEQLIRVQSIRLRRGVDFEKNTSLTNQHLHKDIAVAKDLIESLARVRGKFATPGRPSQQENSMMSNAAHEGLRKVEKDEGKQDKLAGLLGNLTDLMAKRAKHETAKN